MYRTGTLALVSIVFAAGSATTATAQQADPPERQMRETKQTQLHFALSQDVIGMNVVNREGEEVGKITDLIVNARTGHVTHAVASFGGWLGIGDSVVVVPTQSITSTGRSAEDRQLQFAAEKEDLSTYPTFKPDRWQGLRTREWAEALPDARERRQGREGMEDREDREGQEGQEGREEDRRRGRQPDRDPMRERDARYAEGVRPLIRLSDISGTGVSAAGFEFESERQGDQASYERYRREVALSNNDELQKIGDIDGAVIELTTWRVPFGVVSTGGVFGYGADDRLVPWDALHFVDGRLVISGITQEQFKKMRPISEDSIANLDSEQHVESIYKQFGMTPPEFKPARDRSGGG